MTSTIPLPLPPADLPRLPARLRDDHKGRFGTVAVVGGCDEGGVRMVGAPALTATAALRCGAGMVRLLMPQTILTAGLTSCPEATGLPIPIGPAGVEAHEATAAVDRAIGAGTVLVLGPGLGTGRGALAATLRAVQQELVPLVLDADGLNCLAAIPEFMRDFRAAAVLTPHPGEFKRLCAALGMRNEMGLSASRANACREMAQRLGRVVVLKGTGTVVSDGQRTWTCPAGHPCLATAGSGDVLTGVIAGVISQFSPPVELMLMRAKVPLAPWPVERPIDLFDAARVGVYAHGLAGEVWARERGASAGLIARDLVKLIPRAIEGLRASGSALP